MSNSFSDPNPYESPPIRAELVDKPKQQPLPIIPLTLAVTLSCPISMVLAWAVHGAFHWLFVLTCLVALVWIVGRWLTIPIRF